MRPFGTLPPAIVGEADPTSGAEERANHSPWVEERPLSTPFVAATGVELSRR
jgi:hypothetical protein